MPIFRCDECHAPEATVAWQPIGGRCKCLACGWEGEQPAWLTRPLD